jgi:hypothetical protein
MDEIGDNDLASIAKCDRTKGSWLKAMPMLDLERGAPGTNKYTKREDVLLTRGS